ncbi:MAG: hypothetical protein AABX27_01615 [Nanoarchaeota archaeon]
MKRLLALGAATLLALTVGCKEESYYGGGYGHRLTPQQQEAREARARLPSCEYEGVFLTGKVLREEFSCMGYRLLVDTNEGVYAIGVDGGVSVAALAVSIDEGDRVKFKKGKKIINGPCIDYKLWGCKWGCQIDNGYFDSNFSKRNMGSIYSWDIDIVEKAESCDLPSFSF